MRNHFLRAAGVPSSGHVTSNLLFHFDANNYSGSGDWLDETSNNHDGALNGDASYTNDGNADYFSFDGTEKSWYNGDGINLGEDSDFALGTDLFTFEFWLYKSSNPVQYAALASLRKNGTNPNTSAGTWQIQFTTNQTLDFFYRDSNASNHTKSFSTVISNTTWTHLCFVREGTGANQFKLYVDGTIDSTTNTLNNLVSASNPNIALGVNRTLGVSIPGRLAIVRFYKGKGLTSSEVTQNYNANKSRYGH